VGSLFWEKRTKDVSADGDPLLPGAEFTLEYGTTTLTVPDCVSAPCTGDDLDPDGGQFCVDSLPLETELTIEETDSPDHFVHDPADLNPKTITLTTSSSCDGTPTEITDDFDNLPLSQFNIEFICVAFSPVNPTECTTRAQITCDVDANDENGDPDQPGPDPTPAFDDTDETFGDDDTTLVPGVYDCEVNIDP